MMRLVFDFDFQLTIFDFSLTYAAERSAYCELLFRYLFILSVFFFFGFSVFLYSSVSHSLVEFSFRCAFRFDCSRIDQGFLYLLLATRHSSLVTR